MARIRTIKPEFWSDAKVAKLSLPARLLFIALWNFADDYGIGRALPREIGGFAFPHDDEIQVKPLLGELEQMEFIKLYVVGDNPYYIIPNWDKHQKVDRPGKAVLPKPQASLASVSRVSRECLEKNHRLDLGSRIMDLGKGSSNASSEKSEIDPLLGEDPSLELELVFDSLEDKKGKPFFIPQKKIDEWKAAFPDLAVESEIRHAIQWHRDNPSKRKTSSGMLRFFFNWLSSASKGTSSSVTTTKGVRSNESTRTADCDRSQWATPSPEDNSLRARLLRREQEMYDMRCDNSPHA